MFDPLYFSTNHFRRLSMLWGLITLLCILWLIAMVAKFTLGGLIHLLLVIAVIVLIFRLVTGRPVV